MTPKEKQKLIAEQAIYGDLMGIETIEYTDHTDRYVYRFINADKVQLIDGDDEYFEEGDDINPLPILRPLSDLTKEITHAGYNNDQPFVPLVELAKIVISNCEYKVVNKNLVLCKNINKRGVAKYHFNEYGKLRLSELDLLNLWHFDVRGLIESNEAISTDVINPYEVK